MYQQKPFGRKNALRKRPTDEGVVQGRGDFRGTYGFGRQAHKTDASATYGFSPDSSTPLRRKDEK